MIIFLRALKAFSVHVIILFMSYMGQKDLLDPEVTWIPRRFTFHKFKVTAKFLLLLQSLLYSTLISCGFALPQMLVSTLAGFVLARYKFPQKRLLFGLMSLPFIIPVQLAAIPHLLILTTARSRRRSCLIAQSSHSDSACSNRSSPSGGRVQRGGRREGA